MASVDKSTLQQMSNADGQLMFRDADNKTVLQTLDEEGNATYAYEDGTAFEGTDEDLSAVMGYPAVDAEKGAMYTDADGNTIYKNTDEEGNDVYTREDGTAFDGDVDGLKVQLKEYVEEDGIIAGLDGKLDELEASLIGDTEDVPEGEDSLTGGIPNTPEAQAEQAGLETTDKKGAYTKETPMGTFLYAWDPQENKFNEFPACDPNDKDSFEDCDFTTDGRAIDRTNEDAVKAEAMITIQNDGYEVDPNGTYPFSVVKDGVHYEYDKEKGEFVKVDVSTK